MKSKFKFRKAVFTVIYSQENNKINYLLLKRHKHWRGWEFSKGGIDKGENSTRTAKREIKEETGLKILNLKKYNIKGKYRYNNFLKDRPGLIGQNYILFSAEVRKGKVKIDKKEHSGFRWMNFEKAVKKLTWPNQKKCLRIVNKNLKNRL